MDIFGDVIVRKPDRLRAQDELAALQSIEAGSENMKEKCTAVWQIISFGLPVRETTEVKES